MKTLIALFILTSVRVMLGEIVNDNCVWKYKCCKFEGDICVQACEPEIICNENDEVEFFPFQVFNVKCKFGYKSDNKNRCRKIM